MSSAMLYVHPCETSFWHSYRMKQRGWESEAILNWLALAGWGVQRAPPGSSSSSSHAPDSTQMMSVEEMIHNVSSTTLLALSCCLIPPLKFDFSSVTHRRSVLDPMKLEHINKHHLMQLMSSPEGLSKLAGRAASYVKAACPGRCVCRT